MGYELINDTGKSFYLNYNDYVKVYELADTYGWKPKAETFQSSDEEKEGEDDYPDHYLMNDIQLVSAEEAASMADVLERSLEDISSKPVRTADKKDIIKGKCPNGIILECVPIGYYDDWDAVSYWGGQEPRIGKFIEFLRLGSYRTE